MINESTWSNGLLLTRLSWPETYLYYNLVALIPFLKYKHGSFWEGERNDVFQILLLFIKFEMQ